MWRVSVTLNNHNTPVVSEEGHNNTVCEWLITRVLLCLEELQSKWQRYMFQANYAQLTDTAGTEKSEVKLTSSECCCDLS